MVAAIAHMGGHDIRSDRVKTVCFACLCGSAAVDIIKDAVGKTVGRKLAEEAIRRLSAEAIKKINQAVGFRLLTKFGQTGVINMGKGVPVVGGIVGGAFDGTTTYSIGRVAKRIFVIEDEAPRTERPEAEPAEETALFGDLSRLLAFDREGGFPELLWRPSKAQINTRPLRTDTSRGVQELRCTCSPFMPPRLEITLSPPHRLSGIRRKSGALAAEQFVYTYGRVSADLDATPTPPTSQPLAPGSNVGQGNRLKYADVAPQGNALQQPVADF